MDLFISFYLIVNDLFCFQGGHFKVSVGFFLQPGSEPNIKICVCLFVAICNYVPLAWPGSKHAVMPVVSVARTVITLVFIHSNIYYQRFYPFALKSHKVCCGAAIFLDSTQAMTGKFKCVYRNIYFAVMGNNWILNGFSVYIKMEMKMLPVFTSTCRFFRQQIANESWPDFIFIQFILYFSWFFPLLFFFFFTPF